MQKIVLEKPYQFVPPRMGTFWPNFIQRVGLLEWYLKRYEGVTSYRIEGIDHLRESMRLKRGVILAPNHCRLADPMVMGFVSREIQKPLFAMASWHLFEQHWFMRWALQAMGAFSIYREGVDKQSLDAAIEILTYARRPLVLFPEGAIFRTNDKLQALLDGVAFIARTAAKRQAKKEDSANGVVIHPIAIKYVFHGDLKKSVEPVLDTIDQGLTWQQPFEGNVRDRIARIIRGLLALKEIEYLGEPQRGSFTQRQSNLVDSLLRPIEDRLLGRIGTGPVIPRIKALRVKIVPELSGDEISSAQRTKYWKDLSDIYLSQQVAAYPPEYLTDPTTDTCILETVERLEEDLTDRTRVHSPFEAVIQIAPAIDVPSERAPRGEEDPIMIQLRSELRRMLAEMAGLAHDFKDI
jgi:1-acyl-sn-glycerol-3-phosphate acyltransferase